MLEGIKRCGYLVPGQPKLSQKNSADFCLSLNGQDYAIQPVHAAGEAGGVMSFSNSLVEAKIGGEG